MQADLPRTPSRTQGKSSGLPGVPICPSFHAARDNPFSDVVRSPCRSPPCRSRIPVAPERTMPGGGKDPERGQSKTWISFRESDSIPSVTFSFAPAPAPFETAFAGADQGLNDWRQEIEETQVLRTGSSEMD